MKSAQFLGNDIWDWISQIVSQRPEEFLAALLFAFAVISTLAVIIFFSRLRILSVRLRQLHQVTELQAAMLEKLKAHIDEKISSVSWQQQRFAATMTDVQKRADPSPAALIREELASARMDMLADEPVHGQMESP